MTRVLVVGSGLAGCTAALAAAREGADVTVLTKATRPEDANSYHAQGGVAVVRESRDAFASDVLDAADGHADPAAVESLARDANPAFEDVLVETLDVPFAEGFGREAAHSVPRIRHVGASTGRHVLPRFLDHLADRREVDVRSDVAARDLRVDDGRVTGVVTENRDVVAADSVVLATGGAGACFPRTTNPDAATGDGVAMAARADAAVADAAFVQFHPTALPDGTLVSEAVRGEGAVLRNARGDRFMPRVHDDAELAPRDVVARAVARERDRTGDVVLDPAGVDVPGEFPDLADRIRDADHDPTDPVPVAPAAHFLCGGVAVDERGRTSIDGLFAAGECARTGVHGANRLASTSLLEALVWGRRAGRDAARAPPAPDPAPLDPPAPDPPLPDGFAAAKFDRLHGVTGDALGPFRRPADLRDARDALRRLLGEVDAYARNRDQRDLLELRNAATVALLVAEDAAARDSAGCHHVAEVADARQ